MVLEGGGSASWLGNEVCGRTYWVCRWSLRRTTLTLRELSRPWACKENRCTLQSGSSIVPQFSASVNDVATQILFLHLHHRRHCSSNIGQSLRMKLSLSKQLKNNSIISLNHNLHQIAFKYCTAPLIPLWLSFYIYFYPSIHAPGLASDIYTLSEVN